MSTFMSFSFVVFITNWFSALARMFRAQFAARPNEYRSRRKKRRKKDKTNCNLQTQIVAHVVNPGKTLSIVEKRVHFVR